MTSAVSFFLLCNSQQIEGTEMVGGDLGAWRTRLKKSFLTGTGMNQQQQAHLLLLLAALSFRFSLWTEELSCSWPLIIML
jgi:hypothetical protein